VFWWRVDFFLAKIFANEVQGRSLAIIFHCSTLCLSNSFSLETENRFRRRSLAELVRVWLLPPLVSQSVRKLYGTHRERGASKAKGGLAPGSISRCGLRSHCPAGFRSEETTVVVRPSFTLVGDEVFLSRSQGDP
jgi:hypothetical protein